MTVRIPSGTIPLKWKSSKDRVLFISKDANPIKEKLCITLPLSNAWRMRHRISKRMHFWMRKFKANIF
jgi:hypothetical protein